MKGIIRGFEPVDYISKKTGQPVKGGTFYFDCKSKSAFGYVGKNEYIPKDSPIYKRVIDPIFEKLCDDDSIYFGGIIDLDYDVTQRGSQTFKDVIDLTLTPRENPEKKAGWI